MHALTPNALAQPELVQGGAERAREAQEKGALADLGDVRAAR